MSEAFFSMSCQHELHACVPNYDTAGEINRCEAINYVGITDYNLYPNLGAMKRSVGRDFRLASFSLVVFQSRVTATSIRFTRQPREISEG